MNVKAKMANINVSEHKRHDKELITTIIQSVDLFYFSNLLRIPEKELRELINKKISEFYGLIDEETALLLVLKDFGIDIKEFGKWKVKNLVSGIKVSEISLVLDRKLFEKENLIIYSVYDDTGKIKLIFKGKIEEIKNIMKEGKVIKVKNAIVLKNKTLALFVNNPKLIEEEKNDEIIKNLLKVDKNIPYISEIYCKVINKMDNEYIILTDNFSILRVISDTNLEIGKTYHIKLYLDKPGRVFFVSEVHTKKIN